MIENVLQDGNKVGEIGRGFINHLETAAVEQSLHRKPGHKDSETLEVMKSGPGRHWCRCREQIHSSTVVHVTHHRRPCHTPPWRFNKTDCHCVTATLTTVETLSTICSIWRKTTLHHRLITRRHTQTQWLGINRTQEQRKKTDKTKGFDHRCQDAWAWI